jgi:hypothetical protein
MCVCVCGVTFNILLHVLENKTFNNGQYQEQRAGWLWCKQRTNYKGGINHHKINAIFLRWSPSLFLPYSFCICIPKLQARKNSLENQLLWIKRMDLMHGGGMRNERSDVPFNIFMIFNNSNLGRLIFIPPSNIYDLFSYCSSDSYIMTNRPLNWWVAMFIDDTK